MIVSIAMLSSVFAFSQVNISTDGLPPHSSAMLEVKSANRGLLLPRMNFASRPVAPATGLVIYQLDGNPGIYYFDGSSWQKMSLAAYDFWYPNGTDIYFNTGRVAIGTTTPDWNGLNVVNYMSGTGAVRGADQSGQDIYAVGYLGVVDPQALGVPSGQFPYNIGVLGIKPSNGAIGAAIYGWNNDNNGTNYAGLFYADGNYNQGINYGLYSVSGKALYNFAGYFKGRVQVDGNTGPSLITGSMTGSDSLNTVFSARVKHTTNNDTRAVEGLSIPRPGYGIGVYGEGGYYGVEGVATSPGYTGSSIGVYGTASGASGTRIGIYGAAYGGATNWASYFAGSNYMSGDLRLGTTSAATGYILSVNGKIACTEVLVQAFSSWPDYVFKPDYKLMSLDDLEESIRDNGHLPGLPSAKEIETGGLKIGSMQKQVVEKVEELTLYTIEQGKLLKEQGKMLQEFRKEIDALKAENAHLKKMTHKN